MNLVLGRELQQANDDHGVNAINLRLILVSVVQKKPLGGITLYNSELRTARLSNGGRNAVVPSHTVMVSCLVLDSYVLRPNRTGDSLGPS
jgi:hypothetical protein